jgi:hypothetical protein
MPIDVITDPARELFEIPCTGEHLDHAPREVLEERRWIGKGGSGSRLSAEEVVGVEVWSGNAVACRRLRRSRCYCRLCRGCRAHVHSKDPDYERSVYPQTGGLHTKAEQGRFGHAPVGGLWINS